MYRIGVDVGGTNTDSVLIDINKVTDPKSRGVIAFYKHSTTEDITTGIEIAVKNVLDEANVDPRGGQVLSLTIGTTHFINAILQSDTRRLARVAVVRLASPYSADCPPFIDFPSNLRRIMEGHTAIIKGGLQIDGRKINDLDEAELINQAAQIKAKGIKNIVIAAIFSPLDVDGLHEYRAREILQRELGKDVNIVCSRDVGQLGFLERENASILNAAITSYAQRTIRAFERAMKKLGLGCPLYITQNDGTLTTASFAARLPIRTFSSGATNSMRGASLLAGLANSRGKKTQDKLILVADIGGTSTDVGVLLPSGFPRQAAKFIEVAGVRTNFSMPDITSIGLGGGSIVHLEPICSVGPDSVGHLLTTKGKVFGGDVLTGTDVSVYADGLNIGDPRKLEDLDKKLVQQARDIIKHKLENVVDRMKTNPDDCILLLVGGGSILAPESLKGVGEIIKPPFHSVANAVGAALTSVPGEVDTIEIFQGRSESVDDRVEKLKEVASAKAVENGADAETVRVVAVDVLPVQYVTNQATRIVVKAVGELGTSMTMPKPPDPDIVSFDLSAEAEHNEIQIEQNFDAPDDKILDVDYESYKPKIVGDEWILSETDLLFIAEGCGVLGCGGGGSPHPNYLVCREILRREGVGSMKIADHTSLPPSAYVVRGGGMGSPSVSSERLGISKSLLQAGRELAQYCGITKFVATLSDEIGGSNGMEPLKMSHFYGVPAFDGDLMGRAYPMLDQVLPSVYDRPNALIPCSLCDGNGNVVLLTKANSHRFVETLMRSATTEMGSAADLCLPPLSVADARDYGIVRSQSLAWRIGRAICIGRQKRDISGIPRRILQVQNGKWLFTGKITKVAREVRAGFTWGEIHISKLTEDELEEQTSSGSSFTLEGSKVVIPFQNENLCVYLEDGDGARSIVTIVPDLIAVLDSQSGSNLGTQDYAYGLRVTVLALAASPLWTNEVGLKRGGPAAFGLPDRYVPIAEFRPPVSVIEEYKVV